MTVNKAQAARIGEARLIVAKQLLWIERCGGDLEGYLAKYGSLAARTARFAPGTMDGEAFYAADKRDLVTYQAQLDRLLAR